MKSIQNIKVLVIDDDFIIVESIKKLLVTILKNVSIYTSNNGIRALGLLQLKNPDLIIIDTTLPEFAGDELVKQIKSKEGFTNASKILLIHEDDKLPEINDPSIVMLSKKDNKFIEKFVNYLKYTFSVDVQKTYRQIIHSRLMQSTIKYSNECDVLMHKISRKRDIRNIFRWTKWLALQIFLSLLLTIFYLYGGKVKEENDLDLKVVNAYRVRYYPTLATLIVGGFIFLSQIGVFVASGFAVLNTNLRQLMAQTACTLPIAPSVINTQIVVSPDNIDGIIDCSGLDIIVGSTGELVIERNVTINGSTNGDYGVTLLVNNLTVQNGGKITADGKGYQIIEAESVGQGGSSAGQTGGAGGGHGGAGGQAVEDISNPSGYGGSVYGNNETPTTLGGAGGTGGGSSTSYSKTWNSTAMFSENGSDFSSGIRTKDNQLKLNSAQQGSEVPTDGLSGYWKFDESSYVQSAGEVIDSSGNNNHFNSINPANTDASGKYDRALLPGGGAVQAPNSGIFDFSDAFTLSVWIKPTDGSNYKSVIGKSTGFNAGYLVYLFGGSCVAFDVTNTEYTACGITLNEWNHIVASYDGSAMKLWINNNLVINGGKSGQIGSNGNIFTIGGGYPGAFAGLIDEARVYNRALTDSEITQLYEYTSSSPEFASGEQTWKSAVISAGVLDGIKLETIAVDWSLDGTDNLNPKIQLQASSTGNFTGEETVFPASGEYYQQGETYNIDDSTLKNLTEITNYYKYWRVIVVLDTGVDVLDTPTINGITITGTAIQEGNAQGGAGGGAIKIVSSGNIQVNGIISANGLDGQALGVSSGGGGAGGSIWIEAVSFSGSGIVRANGGSSAEVQYQGGGGGGGRIVMLCSTSNSFNGSASVAPGVTANSQDGGIGTIIGPTCRPNAPSVLKQFKSNQSTEVPVNGITTETTVVFVSNLSDVDAAETLSLQIELRQLGQSFTGVPNYTQVSPFSNPQACTTPTSNCGKIVVNNLDRSKEYHWQARIRDSKGGYSQWVSFGANLESDRDILVTGLPSNFQYISGNSQNGIVNTNVSDPLIVRVTDAQGFPVPGYSVGWSVLNSAVGGQLIEINGVTDNDGYSSKGYKLGSKTGTNIVRASASGLNGNPIDFTFTGRPDTVSKFTITAPQYGLSGQNFGPVTVTAFDQYDNIKTDYTGTPSVIAVKALDNSAAAGTLSPSSLSFQLSDNGVLVLNNFNHDTIESIKIKVTDGSATGLSNSVAIVETLGMCPDIDGIVDVNQNWIADTNNQGVFDCRGLNITVQSGAVLTLTPYDNGNNQITDDFGVTILTDNLSVENGSSIVSNGTGYAADTIYGSISYGGYGTTGGTPYGNVYEPDDLGAAGSSGNKGGGAIKLVVDGLTNVVGSISANGDGSITGSCGRAAGAGGSIWIQTNTFSGSGLITANGASQYNCSNAYPSGGRIAIYYSDGNYVSNAGSSLMDLLQARGGGGGPGTIYIEHVGVDNPRKANLYVDNANSNSGYAALVEGVYEFNSVKLTRYGHLNVMGQNSELIVPVSNVLGGDSTSPTLGIEGIFHYQGEDTLEINGVNVDIKGEILLDQVDDIRIGNNLIGALTLRAKTWAHNNVNQYYFGDINIDGNGTLNLVSYDDGLSGTSGDYGVTLNALNLDIAINGKLSADNNGYVAGNTAGKYLAYGGYGTTGAVPYGNVYEPTNLGAPGSVGGNNGGGAMHLIINNQLTVNGTISSTGGASVSGSCGRSAGTGGSVWIETQIINGGGSGVISANGNSQYNCGGEYPSGGRVAIYYTDGNYFSNMVSSNLTDFVQARGLSGGGPGTIYIEQVGLDPVRGAKLYVDNANSNGWSAGLVEGSYEFEQISLTRYGHLTLIGNNSLLSVSNGSSLKGDSTSSNLGIEGTFRYTGQEELSINGIDVDIQGEISLLNGDDFTVGNTSIGGIIFRAKTWAHNKTNQYTFGNITVGTAGVITLVSTYDGVAGTTNDYGVVLNADNINVQAGGLITADNLGYGGEQYLAYGGYGTTGAVPYGNVYEPSDLGAPGSSGNYGGGAIKLNVSDTLTVNGTISSVGGSAVSGSCGRAAGTGGSIWINTNNFVSGGTPGVIRANGSSQYNCSGHYPSGGRVAIYYNNGNYFTNMGSNNVTDFVQARGLSGGGPGTIYIEKVGVDPVKGAKLYVDNANSNGWSAGLVQGNYEFNQINLTRYGHLTVLGNSSILTVSNGASLVGDATASNLAVDGTFKYTGVETLAVNGVNVDIKGEITLENGNDLVLGNTLAGGLTLRANTWAHNKDNQYTFGDVNIGSSGRITLVSYDDGVSGTTGDYGVFLTTDNLTIATGGTISADNQGYSAGTSAGKYLAYGGYSTTGAVPYGSVYEPTNLGAPGSVGGNNGGGSIRLKVNNTLLLNGSITSAGGASVSGSCGRSGGTGGSIWIETSILNSTNTSGVVSANGTAQYNCSGHYSSGGRIAIYYTDGNYFTNMGNNNLTNYVQSRGGGGGPGTIYIEKVGVDPVQGARLFVDNAGNNSWRAGLEAGNYQFNEINLTRYGNIELMGNNSTLTVTNGASLKGDNTSPDFTVAGTFLYTGQDELYINGMDIDINGDIQLVNGDNFTLGNTLQGGIILRANTWAHNKNTPYTFGDITIGQYGLLTLTSYDDGVAGTTGDYGTHVIADNINLMNGGIISADNQGYYAGTSAGKYMSYGGYGNGGYEPYGDIFEPIDLGAPGNVGGNSGGGAIKLSIANTFTLNGIVTSAGGASVSGSCGRTGGTGGSIWIDTTTLNSSGTTGIIRANGTAQYNCGGGYPSGGRVAVYYSDGNFFSNLGSNPVYNYIYARGGGGGPGTVYIEQKGAVEAKRGDLYIDNAGAGGRSMSFEAIDYNLNNVFIGSNVTTTLKQDLMALRSNEVISEGGNVENMDSALAIWNFEEQNDDNCSGGGDYCDTSGNNRNLSAFSTARNDNGKVGKALQLDGNSYAEVDLSSTSVTSFTVGMWAKLSQFTANGSDAEELINFNNISTTSSLDLDGSRNLRFEWPSKLVTGLVSQGKTATMLNNNPSYPPSYCFDGNTSNLCHGSVSGANDWIQVDLGEVKNISKVDIWNRSDCCQERFKSFKIEVSNTGTFTGEQTQVVNLSNQTVGRPSEYTFTPINARYVRVTKLNSDWLNIAEIQVFESASYLPDSQWQHIVATYDSSTGYRKIYVNGVKVNEANQGTGYTLPITKISLGKGGLGSSTGFVGLIDEVFLYPRALTDTEINIYKNTYSWNEYNNKRGRGPLFNLTGNFTLETGAVFTGKALGFPSENGLGKGNNGAGQSGGAGGGHGGSGGLGESDGGNPAASGGTFYGNQRTPLTLGSGGGKAGTGAAGGAGGGALAVRARTGNVSIKGTIDVSGENGKTASPGGGGGAGGSILVEGQTCNITGTLNAQGGNGGDDAFDGGGGGGGRISILYTQGPCNAGGTVTVANGTSPGGQSGQVGTYPQITSIPSTPTFKDQYKSDGETSIPVGGTTPEQIVNLKASVSDPAASILNPQDLVAEFEVVGVNQIFTTASILKGKIIPDTKNTVFAGVYNSPSTEFVGGVPLVAEVNVSGLQPGQEYKWRARVVNQQTSVAGSWTDFGNNSSNQADFVVSNTVALNIIPDKTTVIVGEPITLTVSAKDTNNNTDSTYRGTVTFTSNPSANASLPSDYIFGNSDNGSHSFNNQLVFTQAGTYTVTVTDVIANSLTATTSTITVNNPPAQVNSLQITPSKTTVAQGESLDLQVTAYDQYSSIYTSYSGTVTFGSTAGSNVTLPGNYTYTGSNNGSNLFNNVVFSQAGTYTITVTDISDSNLTATTTNITVTASVNSLTIAPNKTTVVAGEPITLNVNALNSSSQNDIYYRGTVAFTSTAGSNSILPENYTFLGSDNGAKVFTNGLIFTQEGTYTVTVTDANDNSLTAQSVPITVTAPPSEAGADALDLTSNKLEVFVGETITLTVTAKDQNNNNASEYLGTVVFSSNASPDVTLPSNYLFVIQDNGVKDFVDQLTFLKDGEYTVTVKDVLFNNLTDTVTIKVNKSTQKLAITPSKTNLRVGDSIDLTVDALNNNNQNDILYRGNVEFSSTAQTASLPQEYTFTGADNGKRIFSNGAKFPEAGIFTVSVKDKVDTNLTATSENIIVNPINICETNPFDANCLADVVITNVTKENVNPEKETICWKTNVATVGYISYGTAESKTYSNSTPVEADYVENHCMTIENLNKETQYIFKINATSNAGKTAEHEDTFTTGGEIIPVSDTKQCIANTDNYAFNSNGQAVITYQTQEESVCSLYYGNSNDNLKYTYTDNLKVKNHKGVVELSNIDGVNDIYYKVECSTLVLSCSANGIIPVSRYINYYPQPTPFAIVPKEVVPLVLTVATLATAVVNIATYPGFILYAIPWIGSRRRKSTWGIIYDEKSHSPIPFAMVRIYDEVGKIQKQFVTGFDGKYGFLVDKGTYILEVKHSDYNFEKFEVSIKENEGIAAKNIGLVAKTIKKNTFKDKVKNLTDRIKSNLPRINNSIVIVGFIISIVAALTTRITLNYIVFAIYLLQFAILVLANRRKREWGYVYDSGNYQRIKNASVRVFDIDQGRQIDIQLTDEEGRFGFELKEGTYYLQANAVGYELDENRVGSKYKTFNSPTGQLLIKVSVKKGEKITVTFPMKKSNEVLGKFGM